MKKNPTTLQQQFVIVGDHKIISDPKNDKLIRENSKILKVKEIKNTKLTSLNSVHDSDYGPVGSTLYSVIGKNKKPSSFYFIPNNSLDHSSLDELINLMVDNQTKTGEIKIVSGEICFKPLGKTEHKTYGFIGPSSDIKDKKVKKNLEKAFKNWNNTFVFKVENGKYEVFQFDHEYDDEYEIDTMFSVIKCGLWKIYREIINEKTRKIYIW